MFAARTKDCCVFSFDYLDYDVYLNVLAFYRFAGYRVHALFDGQSPDLVVILRGWPPEIYANYAGVVHVYDYVKELSIDYSTFFPSASHIFYISISSDSAQEFLSSDKYTYVHGFLPVIPEIWMESSSRKTSPTPLHISNFKPMQKDLYQSQLVHLSHDRLVQIFGSKWERAGIASSPVSYWTANHLLAKASHCYGLMYPYQRGKSLSGRMWQAPINGCYVISELGTNIFHCPGIIEAADYIVASDQLPPHSPLLASESVSFWKRKTNQLASDLNLSLSFVTYKQTVRELRFALFKKHLLFQWNKYFVPIKTKSKSAILSSLRSLLRSFH